jgi:hypothetical protein
MNPHIARHLISRNPKRQTRFTGKFDKDGEPIVRAITERVRPGSAFIPTDEAELTELLGLNAARPLTSDDLQLYETGQRDGFPIDPVDPEAGKFTRTRESWG